MSTNLIHFRPWGPNAEGIPEAWPYTIREQQQGRPLPDGWVSIERAELDAYLAPMRAQYESALAARPAPVPEPPPVPQSVTPWQMRRALNQLGLRATVEAAVAAGDQDVRDAWDYALEIRRDNPLLAGLASNLGMTSAQLDDLFRLAASFH